MSSPTVALRKAWLARLQAGGAFPGGEQVLDHMPSSSHLELPYLAFEQVRVVSATPLSGSGALLRYFYTVEITGRAVVNPHETGTKTLNDFIDEIDAQLATDLDLSDYGRTNREQVLSDIDVFGVITPAGAELKHGRITLRCSVQ